MDFEGREALETEPLRLAVCPSVTCFMSLNIGFHPGHTRRWKQKTALFPTSFVTRYSLHTHIGVWELGGVGSGAGLPKWNRWEGTPHKASWNPLRL